MKITRFNHMAYNVAGAGPEARDFYLRFLGLPEVPITFPGRPTVMGSDRGFWLEQAGVQMHIIPKTHAATGRRSISRLALDSEAAIRNLSTVFWHAGTRETAHASRADSRRTAGAARAPGAGTIKPASRHYRRTDEQ